ncbi:MAG: hypothetical protein LBM09_00820 [Candidatus Nomurabacteria bacterium]|nr:hypothetical protein [Candidatus Nomurabacteria bacterium]
MNSTIFQGGGTEYKDNCSEIKASGTVAVTYNTDDPQNNSPRHGQAEWRSTVVMLETIGFGILIACIVRLRYIHRNFDATGDGIGDNRPATNEQMKIIENGMRELGQFYAIPSSRLTHEQAKQAIDNINQQIANMRAHKKL